MRRDDRYTGRYREDTYIAGSRRASGSRRSRIRARRVFPLVGLIKLAMIGIILGLIILGAIRVQAVQNSTAEAKSEKVYTTIELHSGDTLWDIAREYCETDSSSTLNHYIREIRRINHITNDHLLKPGDTLQVYYEVKVE